MVDDVSIVFATARASSTLPFALYHLSIGGTCQDTTCQPTQALAAVPRAITTTIDPEQRRARRVDRLVERRRADSARMVKTGGCSGIATCPVVIATGQTDPQGLVVWNDTVYWADTGGTGTLAQRLALYRTCAAKTCASRRERPWAKCRASRRTRPRSTSPRAAPTASPAGVWKLAK